MRLKNKTANHVSPAMHEELQRHIETEQMPDEPTSRNPGETVSRAKIQGAEMEFVIAKRLLAALPIVPTNERVYELAQDIHAGYYDDISSLEEAESEGVWEAWKERTMELLRSKNIVISKKISRLKKNANMKKSANYNVSEFRGEIIGEIQTKVSKIIGDKMEEYLKYMESDMPKDYFENSTTSYEEWADNDGYSEFRNRVEELSNDIYHKYNSDIDKLSEAAANDLEKIQSSLFEFLKSKFN